MTKAFRTFLFFTCAGLALGACGGQLYKVAVPLKVAPAPLPTTESGFVVAARVLTGDEAMEQFDANLALTGLVAVDVRLANRTATTLPLAALKWELHDGGSALFKLLTPKQALSRVMHYYGNRLYAQAAYQQTRASYETLALPVTATLEPQAERRGFLFFETKQGVTSLTGLTLTISGQGEPLRLQLN